MNPGIPSRLLSKLSNAFKLFPGVFNSSLLPKTFFPEFLSEVERKPEVLESWQKKYGKSMNDSLKEYLVKHVGKPIADMIR